MYALVLTFDKYKPFAQHMIMCYEELWPDNPFVFRVPYQSESVKAEYEKIFGNKVEMIESPSGIVDTMFALSDDLDGDELIYWCMDDRYPMQLNTKVVNDLYEWMISESAKDITATMFINAPRCWLPQRCYYNKYLIYTPKDQKLVRRKDYMMIWNHQFMRVEFCRYFFNHFPRTMKGAKQMDHIRDTMTLPEKYKLYMLDHNAGIYGESTSRGMISTTCINSLKAKGLPVPENFDITNKKMVTGDTTKWDNFVFLFKFYIKKLFVRC